MCTVSVSTLTLAAWNQSRIKPLTSRKRNDTVAHLVELCKLRRRKCEKFRCSVSHNDVSATGKQRHQRAPSVTVSFPLVSQRVVLPKDTYKISFVKAFKGINWRMTDIPAPGVLRRADSSVTATSGAVHNRRARTFSVRKAQRNVFTSFLCSPV